MSSELRFGGHGLLGRLAFASLPRWEKDLIKPDMSPSGLAKPYLPAGITTVEEKAGIMCCILDFIYYDECRPYATLPDGRWIPHSPPDANMQSCVGSGLPRSNTATAQLLESLLDRMLEDIRRGDWEEAIRHGGALAHFIQEPFTPGHAFDNDLFQIFFPDPDPGRHMRLHHFFDAAGDGFEPLPPRLMGMTVPEAAFRLQVEMERGRQAGAGLVPALIASAYNGESMSARQKILAGQCRQAVFVTASAWHTLFAIAFSRLDERESAALSSFDLAYHIPYFVHHCQYAALLPGCLVRNKRKIPIHVWNAPGKEQLVEHGFGLGGHMGMKFFVNGNVFPRFRCRAGLPSRHTEGQTPNTRTRFFVEIDEKENLVYSEDMEYRARRLVDMPLVPGEPVRQIDVSIKGARTLILTAQTSSYRKADGTVAFDVPHVAVCEPTLLKK